MAALKPWFSKLFVWKKVSTAIKSELGLSFERFHEMATQVNQENTVGLLLTLTELRELD
jgi:hypothetical protein